jgi:hypothetical protein
MERMALQYSEAAAASGCYISCAAGFDSIPGDVGTLFTQRLFKAPALPCSVECVLSIQPGPSGYRIHYATWWGAPAAVWGGWQGSSARGGRRRRGELRWRWAPLTQRHPGPPGAGRAQ